MAPDFGAPPKPPSSKPVNRVVESACLASFGIAPCAFACFRPFSVSERLPPQIHAPGAVHTTRFLEVELCPDVKYQTYYNAPMSWLPLHFKPCVLRKNHMTEGFGKGPWFVVGAERFCQLSGTFDCARSVRILVVQENLYKSNIYKDIYNKTRCIEML